MSSLIGVTSVTLLGALSVTSVVGAVVFSPIILSLFIMSCLLWFTILLGVVGYQYRSSDGRRSSVQRRQRRFDRLRSLLPFGRRNRREAGTWRTIARANAQDYLRPEEQQKLQERQRLVREQRRDSAFNEVAKGVNQTIQALADVRREQKSLQPNQPGPSLPPREPQSPPKQPVVHLPPEQPEPVAQHLPNTDDHKDTSLVTI
jgi:hypothetical protein